MIQKHFLGKNDMRKSILILLSLVINIFIIGHAQSHKYNDPKVNIPPVIVEGKVEGVPDGTIVQLSVRFYKSDSYMGSPSDVDTVIGGNFRIVHNPDSITEEEFCIVTPNRPLLYFYATPGTTTTIKGRGMDYEAWHVVNDNSLQKEKNEYMSYIEERIPGYYEKRNMAYFNSNSEDYDEIKRESDRLNCLYVENMLNLLETKEYNPVFSKALWNVAVIICELKLDSFRDKTIALLSKVPFNISDRDDGWVVETRKRLELPKYIPIMIGEQMTDFKLYDHNGEEHHLNEFNGNGKYLLIEFNSRTCVGCMEHRPMEFLHDVYKKHSDWVDMLMVNCDDPYFWELECKDENKWGRDPWYEWNDRKACKNIMQRYDVNGPTYYFISPDGIVLGKNTGEESLASSFEKYFKLYK